MKNSEGKFFEKGMVKNGGEGGMRRTSKVKDSVRQTEFESLINGTENECNGITII